VVVPSWRAGIWPSGRGKHAAGLAVIASDLGSFREVLGDAGLLFRTGDAKDLARQIGRALDEPGLAAKLGEQALVRIESEFSYSKMMREHVALYESLAAEK
jgi:phosphatidylinositol alpha-mannosyltransferase